MSGSSTPASPVPPTATLVKATLAALVVAAVVLVTAVLPAEFGIDLVGTGEALGLNNLYAVADTAPPPIEAGEGGPVYPQFLDFRTDTRTLTIPPKQGIEFKYELDKGATMVYSWRANAYVEFDFHTEPEGLPPEASDSFERGNALQKHGGYIAPYNGIHGWYWENTSDREVTLTLRAAGFFDEAMLFLPERLPQAIEIPDPAAQAEPVN